MEIARAARSKVPQSQEKLKQAYGKLLDATSRVVGQARRFSKEIAQGLKRSTDILQQAVLDGLRKDRYHAATSAAGYPTNQDSDLRR